MCSWNPVDRGYLTAPRSYGDPSHAHWSSRTGTRYALAGQSLSQLARQHEVSCKFVAQQVSTAERALDAAFTPGTADDDHTVLFTLVRG